MRGGWKTYAFIVAMALTGVSAVSAQGWSPLDSAAPETRKISVVVDRGITRTSQLPASLRPLRKTMVANQPISEMDLRKLAERGDGLAAMRYAKILLAGGMEKNASDIAFFAAIAAGAGRVSTLDDMIDALRLLEPGDLPREKLGRAIRVLYGHAWAGNTMALAALIDLNGKDRLLGEMSEKTRLRLLETGQKLGDGRIELHLAMKLLAESQRDQSTLTRAEGYLMRAERMGDVTVRAMAANLRRNVTQDLQKQQAQY